jgi:membrane associated rhomboid family serine protease
LIYFVFIYRFGGNLFSCNTDGGNSSIGASTSDFGILFGLLAMICVNWYEFKGQMLE